MKEIQTAEQIEKNILLIRGKKVILDFDLSRLYGVQTRVLIQAVKRNPERFPEDFMFQLDQEELEKWRSQFVTSNPSAKMSLRRRPYVFTEHGAIMAANVLRSPKAVEMSILVVRAFVKLREMLASHKDLEKKLNDLENKYDKKFQVIFDAIRQLMKQPKPKQKVMGFNAPSSKDH